MNEIWVWQVWTFVGILACSNGYLVAGGFAIGTAIAEIYILARG